jgi:hypothetical protein
MLKDSHRPWTPDDDYRLLTLQAAGKWRARIGPALRRSTKGTKARLYILKQLRSTEIEPAEQRR